MLWMVNLLVELVEKERARAEVKAKLIVEGAGGKMVVVMMVVKKR